MDIRRAILAAVQLEADEDLLEKSLIDVQVSTFTSVDLDETYVPATHMNLVDDAAIEVLRSLLSLPDVTEGGLALKYDKSRMAARLMYLEKKRGVYVEDGPTITDISSYW